MNSRSKRWLSGIVCRVSRCDSKSCPATTMRPSAVSWLGSATTSRIFTPRSCASRSSRRLPQPPTSPSNASARLQRWISFWPRMRRAGASRMCRPSRPTCGALARPTRLVALPGAARRQAGSDRHPLRRGQGGLLRRRRHRPSLPGSRTAIGAAASPHRRCQRRRRRFHLQRCRLPLPEPPQHGARGNARVVRARAVDGAIERPGAVFCRSDRRLGAGARQGVGRPLHAAQHAATGAPRHA